MAWRRRCGRGRHSKKAPVKRRAIMKNITVFCIILTFSCGALTHGQSVDKEKLDTILTEIRDIRKLLRSRRAAAPLLRPQVSQLM